MKGRQGPYTVLKNGSERRRWHENKDKYDHKLLACGKTAQKRVFSHGQIDRQITQICEAQNEGLYEVYLKNV